jgi:hypothetical protein
MVCPRQKAGPRSSNAQTTSTAISQKWWPNLTAQTSMLASSVDQRAVYDWRVIARCGARLEKAHARHSGMAIDDPLDQIESQHRDERLGARDGSQCIGAAA